MKKLIGVSVFLVVLYASLAELGPNFASAYNQSNLWRLISLLAIFAIGESFVIITGGIDLSVGSLIAYGGMLAAHMMVNWNTGPAVAIVAVLAMSVGVGVVHGQLVTRLKLPPFLVTLSSLMIFRALCYLMNNGAELGFGGKFDGFRALGKEYSFVVLAVVFLAAHFTLHHTVLGQYMYAVGNNEEAARYSGIRTDRIKRFAFTVSSFTAGLAGLLYAGYLTATGPSVADGYELYAIAAVVLGGCSLSGGEGTILGVVIGAAIIQTLYNGINLFPQVSSYHEKWIIGAVILIAAVLDAAIKRVRKAKR